MMPNMTVIGMEWDEMEWDEMEWDEMEWDEMAWDEMAWYSSHGQGRITSRRIRKVLSTDLK